MRANANINRAMILAAGKGSRLHPLTVNLPKALVPVAGVPLIAYLVRWLSSHHIDEVVVNTHHLGEQIETFLGDGTDFGALIHYSPEEELAGTAGSIKMAERFFDKCDSFVVHYGDVLTDFDLTKMMDFHLTHNGIATLALLRTDTPWESGMVQLSSSGRISGFLEKPPTGSVVGGLLNGGTYILKKEILDYIPEQEFYDFGQHLFPELINLNNPIFGYVLDKSAYLLDIGTLTRYRKVNEDVANGVVNLDFMKSRGSGILV